MQGFRQHLKECMEGEQLLPAIEGSNESVDFFDPSQRDSVNFMLSDITDESFVLPELAYERVRGLLMDFGYSIPPVSFRPGLFGNTVGEEVFGMTRPQHPDEPAREWTHLYFAFAKEDSTGLYDVLAEIVTQEELEKILYEDGDIVT